MLSTFGLGTFLRRKDTYLRGDFMKKDIAFSMSGVTSWGCPWNWKFGSPIKLKDADGRLLLTTDFHTLEPEYSFEDERQIVDFSLSPEQDAEWDNICWDCFHREFTIYGMVQKSFRSSAGQFVRDYESQHPYETWLPDTDFNDMLAACLDATRKQWGWGSKDLEWLFSDDGPINSAVNVWLADYLRDKGFDVN